MVWASGGHCFDPPMGELRVHFPFGVTEGGRMLAGTEHRALCALGGRAAWCGEPGTGLGASRANSIVCSPHRDTVRFGALKQPVSESGCPEH